MRNLFILLVISLSVLSSCKKGKADFVLRGVITDATFNTGLSSGKVYLYEVEAGGSDINFLGSQTIGSDGSYAFTFPRNAAESYILQIEKDNYYSKEYILPFSTLTIEEDNVRNYSTTAKSWVGLHFSTPGTSSLLKYTRQQGKSGCDECCPEGEQIISGAVDTIIYCPNDGNTVYAYNYIANSFFGVKQTTTVAFDTTILTLNY